MKKILSSILSICLCCTYVPPSIYAIETTDVLYGDANCDSDVDIRDVTTLNQHLIGIAEMSKQGIDNCNFFCDDVVNIKTLLNLKKIYNKNYRHT